MNWRNVRNEWSDIMDKCYKRNDWWCEGILHSNSFWLLPTCVSIGSRLFPSLRPGFHWCHWLRYKHFGSDSGGRPCHGNKQLLRNRCYHGNEQLQLGGLPVSHYYVYNLPYRTFLFVYEMPIMILIRFTDRGQGTTREYKCGVNNDPFITVFWIDDGAGFFLRIIMQEVGSSEGWGKVLLSDGKYVVKLIQGCFRESLNVDDVSQLCCHHEGGKRLYIMEVCIVHSIYSSCWSALGRREQFVGRPLALH